MKSPFKGKESKCFFTVLNSTFKISAASFKVEANFISLLFLTISYTQLVQRLFNYFPVELSNWRPSYKCIIVDFAFIIVSRFSLDKLEIFWLSELLDNL